jgi:D-sedoheptulose 7-phosphate isomerase
MNEYSDILFCVPSAKTARIQEVHITIGHIICELVEHELFGNK